MQASDPDVATRSAEPPAWTDQQLCDPHHISDKAQRVRRMFAAIAPSYDLNNRLHSLGIDQRWRRATVRAAAVQPTDTVLDVACGTGDLAMAFAKAGPHRVLGIDFTPDMLSIARRKAGPAPAGVVPLSYQVGDAMRLPVADASVNIVSIAFGIRNVSDPAAAMREFHRVLSPGGRLLILEFSLPTNPLLRGLYNFYFNHILPRTAALIARDRSGAYKYLPRSVNTFINRPAMLDLMHAGGFENPTATPLTMGVAMIYQANKQS